MNLAGRRSIPALAAGTLVTLLVIAAIEVLSRTGILKIPNPGGFILLAVLYAGYSGGLRSGFASAALGFCYELYFFSPPGAPLQFDGENARRIAVLALVAPLAAWMIGTLKDRGERALRQQLEGARSRVAELEESRAQIARLSERLQRALVGSRLVLWELDLRTGMVQLGREWARIVGGEGAPTEVSLAELRELTHPDDLARLDEAFQSFISGRAEHYDVEQRIRSRDGEWKWVRSTGKVAEVDAGGRPIRASGTNRDITSRKQAQLALRENERRLRLIADTVPAMIGYVDAQQRYRYCNRRYRKAMSRPESAILGQTVRAVVGDEDYESTRPWIEKALAGERVEYERRHKWPDGTLADLAVTYLPHVSEDGTVLGLYALLVDLTERKRAERIKERFISMVSHELRTPLTSIIWTLESLIESKASGMSKEESAAVVLAQQNAERMLHLADEILEIEKIDQGELHMNPSVVALPELVGRALALNQGLARKHEVRISAAQLAASVVRADPDRLLQVLSNLISNAAKHSPRGGLVEIAIEPRGKMFRTSIKDNGRGVPEQFREMLFGRFAQSSDGRALGGSGLGLAICKEIVERSGGAIGYHPNPEGGSVFWFELPAAPAAGQGG